MAAWSVGQLAADGSLLISDDGQKLIWRVSYGLKPSFMPWRWISLGQLNWRRVKQKLLLQQFFVRFEQFLTLRFPIEPILDALAPTLSELISQCL
jgi:hypothetical protein